MPISIPIDSLIGALTQGTGAGGVSQAFTMDPSGKYVQNPAFMNAGAQAQLNQTVNGPTPGAIQGGALQAAATTGATLGAQQAMLGQTAIPANDLNNLNVYNTATGMAQPPAIGTTYGDLKDTPTISSSQRDALGGLNAVQSIIDQVKVASKAINTASSGDGMAIGNRSGLQAINALKAKIMADPNYLFLTEGVQGQLGKVSSEENGIAKYSPQVVQSVMTNIPSPYDTKELAQEKLSHLQNLLDIEKKQIIPQAIQEHALAGKQFVPSGGM